MSPSVEPPVRAEIEVMEFEGLMIVAAGDQD
jgi:hypothetical protein